MGRADEALDDREATIVVEGQQEAVAEHGDKLEHLEFGQVSLPPEELLKSTKKTP